MSLLLLLAVNLLTCIGQLLQKQAVLSWQGQTYSLWGKLFSPWLLGSIASLGIGMLLWLRVLQLIPLSVAYPLLSLNLVLITLACHYWFHEPADRQHWTGIALVMVGIVLLGGSV
ncbi:MAG: 4-amino-4-deoxy-L-arabinose-phosphoundecaprenol flippase subunit ArnE [Enterobacteriaceae bacterium]